MEEDFKIFGFDENLKYNKKTKEFLLAPRFTPSQKVYIVLKKKFGRVEIIKDKISYISFTNFINYSTYHAKLSFNDCDKNVFDNKEDAYEYAEILMKRKNIKFYDLVY
ncbi:MAG: hypothetical protein J6F30_08275 [Cellulosilyticum sp.]|nr:hypothetical protein [Cellulosilyticum sp.]